MNILIIGATSAIAKATARLYANGSNTFYLVARDSDALAAVSADIKARGAAAVHTKEADFSDNSLCQTVIDDAVSSLSCIDLAIMAHGILGDQTQCENDYHALISLYQVNTLSSLALLTLISGQMASQKNGHIVFISSVAADRGRPSNYVYGSSKAAVTTFLQGLGARMAKLGVHVMTVKPGFVITPMTEEFNTEGLLWSRPEVIALGIQKGIKKKASTVYLPWFWWPIMTIIKSIPTSIFKRLTL